MKLSKQLTLQIMDWHGGSNTALYSLGSTAMAGKEVTCDMITAGISELEKCKKDSLPEHLADLHILMDNLKEVAAKAYVSEVSQGKWQEAVADRAHAEGVAHILNIGGVYELIEEHFHDEVYDDFEKEYYDKEDL